MSLDAIIASARKKRFLQRFVQKIAIAASACILICGILVALSRAGFQLPTLVWAVAALPWLVLAIWAYPWRTSKIELARQIDKANDFG